MRQWSHPIRDAWIEMLTSRAKHRLIMSHPIRDAWIEMLIGCRSFLVGPGRIPYGMRGLKCIVNHYPTSGMGRIPYGMRGLKSSPSMGVGYARLSHPIRDAWIEIRETNRNRRTQTSHPIRDAWIEMVDLVEAVQELLESHPIRDAWIEIRGKVIIQPLPLVASHTGCVD